MKDLQEIRETIREIDSQIAALFEQRMAAVRDVAAYKNERSIPVLDQDQESRVLARNSSYIKNEELKPYFSQFMKNTMAVSRQYQEDLISLWGKTVKDEDEAERILSNIDLHMHSTASDGTDTVPELLNKVKSRGIRVFALTDHDTIEGSREMERILASEGKNELTLIRGIEFSCISNVAKCHILGYGCDWENESFIRALEKGKKLRMNKLERRLRFMKEQFDITLTDEELAGLRAGGSVGKPHLGLLLASKGLAPNKDIAIDKYINPCKTESDRVDALMVVQAILDSGGIPVWAHPFGGSGEKEVPYETFLKQLDLLTGAGLRGLECYYSKYTDDQIGLLLKAAKKKNLYVSGGSDYHGKNKRIHLGELNASGTVVREEMLSVLEIIGDRTNSI